MMYGCGLTVEIPQGRRLLQQMGRDPVAPLRAATGTRVGRLSPLLSKTSQGPTGG